MKCLFIFVCVIVFVGCNEEDFKKIDAIIQERACIAAGGICTISGDCPKGHLSEKPGLCPQQKKQGIECCHGVSMKETRCQKHGGVCMSPEQYCNPNLVFDGATDCRDKYRCCIMVL